MLLVIQKEHMEPEMKPVFSLGDWRSEEWRHNPYGAADVNMTSQVCSWARPAHDNVMSSSF